MRLGQKLVRCVTPVAALMCVVSAPMAVEAAGHAAVGEPIPGPTPFIATIPATTNGASLAYVTFLVASKSGSLVPPIIATYTAGYLASHGYGSGNAVRVPVWGLYAGSNNLVSLLFAFSDGSSSFSTVPISTSSYVDPCAVVSAPTLTQERTSTNNIGFNFFLLKDNCSKHSPAIFDTDANLRWVGTANVGSFPAIIDNNGVYVSDGNTGIDRIELTGQVTKLVDFAAKGVTSTNQHNMDLGRNGIVVDVNTTAETQSDAVEFDPKTGAVLNTWNMAQILSAAMTAGGDNPSQFVGPLGTDWFHMNATAYNPADGTEIISSRENFVIDVDYQTPADGIKKIHWILGDTTKKWHSFPSLAKYTLSLGANTFPPIGQHAVALDQKGNLLLFDDGNASLYEVPAGLQRNFSAGRSYTINVAKMTATEVINYTPFPQIYTPFCGSFYEPTPNNYLIDFPYIQNGTTEIQSLKGNSFNLIFDLKFTQTDVCGTGWNAVPLTSLPSLFE